MTLRNYHIFITPHAGITLPESIPSEFGCSVSEPSAWTEAPRGLTFTDNNFNPIDNHPVFIHRPRFVKVIPGNPPEHAEVDEMVWSCIVPFNLANRVAVRVQYANAVQI